MKCPRELRGAGGVVIDTNVFIYLFEDHARFGEVAEFIVDEAASGVFSAVVTPITIAELIVKPLEAGRRDIADQYRSALAHMRNVALIDLPSQVGEMAGALRAEYGLPLPDMLQAATALLSAKPIVITNDAALRRIKELHVVSLSEI